MITTAGKLIDLVKAKRPFYCCICPQPILEGEYHFIVLDNKKLDRTHKKPCFQIYLNRNINHKEG